MQAISDGRDACVFWSTGSGKSILFQVPALHLNKPVLCISPLISLMQDQVAKLNQQLHHLGRGDMACLLGTAQADARVRGDAAKGRYTFVYVSPEKVLADIGLLKEMVALCGISCIAIDEAHW